MSKPVTPCVVCGQPTASRGGVCQRSAECRYEYRRRRHEANREADREYMRKYYADNAAAHRQRRRDYVAAHREEVLEASRQHHTENRSVRNEARRLRAAASGDKRDLRKREIVARLWSEQGGLCYLCEEPVLLEDAMLEHDHRCCPLGKFCRLCTRGASHQECNKVAGHGGDDPDRLERIARNLRVKLAEIGERLASKPEQVLLYEDC